MTHNNHKVALTKEGYDELASELDEIKRNKLPKAIERVAVARSHGDLSENSEYHAAREDLAFLEGRVEELEALVAKAQIIRPRSKKTVNLGNKVTVNGNGKSLIFEVVGEFEADPMSKKISHDSPLGRALIGKKVGEKVEYEAPVGKVVYKIEKIH